jgi:hypothetical protein
MHFSVRTTAQVYLTEALHSCGNFDSSYKDLDGFLRLHIQPSKEGCRTEYLRLFCHALKATFRIEQKALLLSLRTMLEQYACKTETVLRAYTVALLQRNLRIQANGGHLQFLSDVETSVLVDLGSFAAVFRATRRARPSGEPVHPEAPLGHYFGHNDEYDPNVSFDGEPLIFRILHTANGKWVVKCSLSDRTEEWTMVQHPVFMPVWDNREAAEEAAARGTRRFFGKLGAAKDYRWQTTHRHEVRWNGAKAMPMNPAQMLEPAQYNLVPTRYTPDPGQPHAAYTAPQH